MNEILDKYLGSFVGGAVADALGAPLEFDEYEVLMQIYGEDGVDDYVEFNGEGKFTDDTQMSLFTAEGLLYDLNSKKNNPLSRTTIDMIHDAYIRWLFTQGYDLDNSDSFNLENSYVYNNPIMQKVRVPGITCLKALSEGVIGTITKPINDRKGCGGVMRVAPIGLAYRKDSEKAFYLAASAAAITHSHPTGYLSSGFLASTIAFLTYNDSLKEAIDKSIAILVDNPGHDETLEHINNMLDLYDDSPSEISYREVDSLGLGFIAEEALAIALFCSLKYEDNYKKGVFAAVNHSGDSDSTGAITGNILGTINGFKSIPKHYKENLEGIDLVETIANDLYSAFEEYNENDELWKRYEIYDSSKLE